MKLAFLIPLYNHGQTLPALVEALLGYGYPVVVVDDGSDVATKKIAHDLAARHLTMTLLERPSNGGKGAAVMDGIRYAATRDYSHVIQIDADGQHDLNTIPLFLQNIATQPTVLWSGKPVYDQSVPKHRFYGRYLTHGLVWLQTVSFMIQDSMCGFRAYPVASTLAIIQARRIPPRMVFDTEIMVRFYWAGGQIHFIPTRVSYPPNGISHFRMVRDNIQLTVMHCRLCLEMLIRLPRLLARHWE
ncbi:glycosyltransferase family 2 protein [Parvibium lacunae]|uniref:Glycosyltransferase family 2 protein n=1 Tax=Parvibium lacunae TaxID=1888893 RepID=A0A368L1W3_9BURK|nr:glycosyltransferase family 2 protein [Parvibium lacunae]RCS57502.1 glycosyltransferase family 2 protein [Parvibium lacunae]